VHHDLCSWTSIPLIAVGSHTERFFVAGHGWFFQPDGKRPGHGHEARIRGLDRICVL
jgi:hypothetical protein